MLAKNHLHLCNRRICNDIFVNGAAKGKNRDSIETGGVIRLKLWWKVDSGKETILVVGVGSDIVTPE